MAGDTLITVVGNLTADPELRFTPGGHAVCNFTVASTPRAFDKGSNEWKDGETLFLPCGVWREAAENTSESLRKGMRVIVSGRLKSRTFETKDGDKRTVVELDVEEVGPSLRYAMAKVARVQRQAGSSGTGNDLNGGGNGQAYTNGAGSGASSGHHVNHHDDAGGRPAAESDPWGLPGTEPVF